MFLLNTAQNGKTEIVELLIGRGADVDITDQVCESSMDSLYNNKNLQADLKHPLIRM